MAQQQQQMEYRLLGSTGLKVSAVGFGNFLTSNSPDVQRNQDEIFQKAWDLGINFFDTAEVYGAGAAEESFAGSIKALNAPRQDLVISTKIYWGQDKDQKLKNQVNRRGLSRKHVIEGTLNSLRRLQLDYADIIYCHRFDHETPVEETVRAFNWLIEQGKIYYWGTSDWSPENIKEAFGESNRLGLVRPVADQCQYNLLFRNRFEVEHGDLFDRHRYGATTWSPLASGLLTGKYNSGIPPDSRLNDKGSESFVKMWYADYWGDNWGKTVEKLNKLEAIGKEIGASLAQLSIAWVVANRDVSTCLLGASRASQLEENVRSLQFVDKITPEIEARINEIIGNRPTPPTNWKTFGLQTPRR